jgi:tetratricopeptide (TPR) repeat protein
MLQEGLDTYELAISTSQKVYGIKHVSTLNLQKQAAAICIQLGFDTKALVLLEGAFENSVDTQNFIQISDTMLCVVAHCHLGNYDVALDIVDCAFLKYESRNHLEDLMELHYQRGQVLSLQNRWLDAKAELASCLSLNRMTRTAPPVVWDAAIALATATSHCGDVLAGLDILREAYAMCITARGAHDAITLSTEHSLARFLWEHFDSTSAQRRDAEAVIARNVEAKRLIFGANHSSTIRSMQLMCQIFSQSDRHAFESALLDLLSSCQRFFGWLHVDTQDALNQLAGFFYEMFEMKIAELLYCVGLCLLDCMSSTQTEFLASKTLSALVKLYHTTAQADKMAVLLEFMRLRGHLDKDLPPHFISRNFFIEILQDSMHPQTITQFLHERISDLKHIVSSNHASYPLVRLSEAILTRNVGQFDRARALFSSCMCEMGNCWWDHPDCSFVVTSLASAMIALSDFESSSDLLFNASAYLSHRDPHVSIHILLSAADMYQSASKNDLAARCLQRVVLLQSSHFGPVSSSALSSQRLLADLYIASREFHLAESVMWDALESCLADQSYPSTTEWLEDLCNLYLCLNNIPKALFMAEEALNTCMVVFGGVHTRTLAALERYARLLRTSGQLFLSREYFEECLQRRIETQGNDAASTNVTRAALADVQMLLQPLMQEQKTASSVLQICDLEADASEALKANDVVSAIQSLAAAFEIAKDTFGSDSVPAARVAVSYGSILLLSEQYQMSILLLRQAVEVLQQNLGRCSKETLVSRAALARALVGKGDLNHAEDILLNCLDQCESSFGLSDRFSMNFVLQLGRLYSMTDCKLQTSRELLQECFWHASVELQDLRGSSKNLCSASFHSMESEFFEILDDLVNVLVRLDDPESAELLLQQAFESHIELYGSSHASSLELISRLATFFVSFIKPQKALPLLRHLLDTKMSVCDFRSTLRAAEDLACVYETMSDPNVAEMLLSFCVTHHRAARKFSPSDFSSCLWRYALVLQKSGKFESALLCFLECLECGSSVFDSKYCVSAAENAGICMMKMGLWRCARLMFSYCVEVLTISKVATESIVNQHMCFCLSNLGIVAACDGDLCDAKKLFMACISLNSTKDSSGDAVELELAECSRNLAIVCQKSGNFSESESFFLKCIEVCEQCKDFSKSLDAQYSLALLRWLVLCLVAMLCFFSVFYFQGHRQFDKS